MDPPPPPKKKKKTSNLDDLQGWPILSLNRRYTVKRRENHMNGPTLHCILSWTMCKRTRNICSRIAVNIDGDRTWSGREPPWIQVTTRGVNGLEFSWTSVIKLCRQRNPDFTYSRHDHLHGALRAVDFDIESTTTTTTPCLYWCLQQFHYIYLGSFCR